MAVATWPATLPQDPIVGWSNAPKPQTVSFTPSTGPMKVRRRTTFEVQDRRLALQLTGPELEILRTFYNTTLAGGSLPFDWTNGDPLDGDTVRYRFKKPIPFKGWVPASDTDNRWYNLTLDLEVINA